MSTSQFLAIEKVLADLSTDDLNQLIAIIKKVIDTEPSAEITAREARARDFLKAIGGR